MLCLLYFQITILVLPGVNGGGCDDLDLSLFDDVTLAVNPVSSWLNTALPTSFCMLDVVVKYAGKGTDVYQPLMYEGRNPVDAAVACYTNVALIRPHLKPEWIVNGQCFNLFLIVINELLR